MTGEYLTTQMCHAPRPDQRDRNEDVSGNNRGSALLPRHVPLAHQTTVVSEPFVRYFLNRFRFQTMLFVLSCLLLTQATVLLVHQRPS
jgi:hypothetical protein